MKRTTMIRMLPVCLVGVVCLFGGIVTMTQFETSSSNTETGAAPGEPVAGPEHEESWEERPSNFSSFVSDVVLPAFPNQSETVTEPESDRQESTLPGETESSLAESVTNESNASETDFEETAPDETQMSISSTPTDSVVDSNDSVPDPDTSAKPEQYPQFEIQGDVSTGLAEQVDVLLDKLPANVLQAFQKSSFALVLTDSDFWTDSDRPDALSKIIYPDGDMPGQILLSARDRSGTALFFEFGHYVDYACGFSSQTDEFAELWEKERSMLLQTFSIYNGDLLTISDSFAASYGVFVREPEQFAEVCPLLYAYFSGCTESF